MQIQSQPTAQFIHSDSIPTVSISLAVFLVFYSRSLENLQKTFQDQLWITKLNLNGESLFLPLPRGCLLYLKVKIDIMSHVMTST